MEKLQVYPNRSVEWNPSAVVALSVSPDGAQLAAAREDGSLEIWLVSPGSVGWHCELTIQGDADSRVSSLVWCRPSAEKGSIGRLLSSSIDGTISEWDLFSVQKNVVLDSIGVSIWQMAVEPFCDSLDSGTLDVAANGRTKHDYEDESEITQDDDDSDTENLHTSQSGINNQRLAVACDDGCVRLYTVSSGASLDQNRSFPRVSGRILSVAWSHCANLIFSGSSDGLIRCWNVTSSNEVYRITVGLGGSGSGSELCVWSLLSLRSGTLVSGDSTGSVQFWDSQQGTLLQAHTYHKGDVNALAAIPGHSRVFSAGSDGQVVLYKLSESVSSDFTKAQLCKWIYVGHVRSHTHDIRALAMAIPISEEPLSDGKVLKVRRRENSFSYQKWAHLGVPMLISGGDDTKLFAYSAREFTQYSPHDICPAPQRPSVKLVHDTVLDGASVMLVQSSGWLDISLVKLDGDTSTSKPFGRKVALQPLARVKSKGSKKIICSAVSNTGMLVSYSDNVKPCLFEMKRHILGKGRSSIEKLVLPRGLPYAHSMLFSADSSRLILAGHDRKIYVVDVRSSKVIHTFVPQHKMDQTDSLPSEPPVVRMFTSADGQWLAAINCFGDIYIFNMEIYRQHWFISRLNGSSVTAGGFPPKNSSVLVLTTSSNEVYVLDVEAKELGEWSKRHTYHLPRRFQEFPGEVIGLSFPPSCSSSVIIYSARAMCFIDFAMPVCEDESTARTKRKRNYLDQNSEPSKWKNFDILVAKDPALFVGHLSENSLLLIEKQWLEVVKSFGAPVHRHIYGT